MTESTKQKIDRIHPLDYSLHRFTVSFFLDDKKSLRPSLSSYKVRKIVNDLKSSKSLKIAETMKYKKDNYIREVTAIPWRIAPLVNAIVRCKSKVKKIENARHFKDYVNTYFTSLKENSCQLLNVLLLNDARYRYLRINEELTAPLIEKLSLILVIALKDTSDERINFIKKALYSLDQVAAEYFIKHPEFSLSDDKHLSIPCEINAMTKDVINKLLTHTDSDKVSPNTICHRSILNFVQQQEKMNGRWKSSEKDKQTLKDLRIQAEKDYHNYLLKKHTKKAQRMKADSFDKMLSGINHLTDEKAYEEDILNFLFYSSVDSSAGVPLPKTDIDVLFEKIQQGTDIYMQASIHSILRKLASQGTPLLLKIQDISTQIYYMSTIMRQDRTYTDLHVVGSLSQKICDQLIEWHHYACEISDIPLLKNAVTLPDNVDELMMLLNRYLSGFDPYEKNKEYASTILQEMVDWKNGFGHFLIECKKLLALSNNRDVQKEAELLLKYSFLWSTEIVNHFLNSLTLLYFVVVKELSIKHTQIFMKQRQENENLVIQNMEVIKSWPSYSSLSDNIATAINEVVYQAYDQQNDLLFPNED
ncbi:hypothetical protein V6615_16080 [Oscillospiraceae bacterium PP1C4]